jgi:membrane associated rhomboid family serine protease
MRETPYRSAWSASIVLIVINAAMYAAQLVVELARRGPPLEKYLALFPNELAQGYVWQLLTFQFLHADALHLIINCAMLYMFGRPVEEALGRGRFVGMYLASGALGGLLQATCGWVFPQHFGLGPVVGASAGVFALIAAFAALNWEQPITTLVAFILPVTMRAKYLILVEVILAGLGMLQQSSQVAHAAHLGGILGGLAFVYLVVKADRELFQWAKFKPAPRRRELVGAQSAKRGRWHRPPTNTADELPPAEFISREVDPILDKISAHGIQSLTERERRILEAARAKMTRK